jgi:hypothetical protein
MRRWHAPATVCDGVALVHRDLGRRRRRATDGCSVLVPRVHGNEDGRGGSGGALRGDEVDCHSGTRRGKRHPQNIDRSLLLQAHGESLPAMIDQAAVPRTSALPPRGEAPSSRELVVGADQRVVGADRGNWIGASMNAEHAHANVFGWLARYQQTYVSEVPGCTQLVALKIYQYPWSPSIPQPFTTIPIENIKQQRTAINFPCPLPYFLSLSERNAWFFNFFRRQPPSGLLYDPIAVFQVDYLLLMDCIRESDKFKGPANSYPHAIWESSPCLRQKCTLSNKNGKTNPVKKKYFKNWQRTANAAVFIFLIILVARSWLPLRGHSLGHHLNQSQRGT